MEIGDRLTIRRGTTLREQGAGHTVPCGGGVYTLIGFATTLAGPTLIMQGMHRTGYVEILVAELEEKDNRDETEVKR